MKSFADVPANFCRILQECHWSGNLHWPRCTRILWQAALMDGWRESTDGKANQDDKDADGDRERKRLPYNQLHIGWRQMTKHLSHEEENELIFKILPIVRRKAKESDSKAKANNWGGHRWRRKTYRVVTLVSIFFSGTIISISRIPWTVFLASSIATWTATYCTCPFPTHV